MTGTDRKTVDLGHGNVRPLLIRLALPAVAAQIVNLLYNVVDRIYIGHMPGEGTAALTGVGLFTPLLTLISAFAMLIGAGGAPRAAIFMGKGDNDEAESILGNCFTLLIGASVLIAGAFYVFSPALLRLFGASDATLPYAVSYARIYSLGAFFILTVLGLNPFITTQGFAKVSMATTLIGAFLNILLDPLFIFALRLGVQGAALATVLSQAVGALWVLRFLTGKQTRLRLRRSCMKLIPAVFLPCLALGISPFVMCSTESLLSISFNSSLARYGGDTAVGAMTILTSIGSFINLPMNGIAQGGQPIISYNYGAGRSDRVKTAFYFQFLLCTGYGALMWLGAMLAPRLFAGLFTADAELLDYTCRAMRIYLMFGFSVGFQMCCQQSFMALGQAKVSLFLACLRKLILLIPLIFILPAVLPIDKATAVFLAEPVSDLTAAAVTTVTFFLKFDGILRKGA